MSRAVKLTLLLLLLALVPFLLYVGMWHFLLVVTGSINEPGVFYGFWSGFAGCLTLFGGLWIYMKKHNCHHDGCWRLQRHTVEGTGYIVCRKHHLEVHELPSDHKIDVDHIRRMHLRHKRGT